MDKQAHTPGPWEVRNGCNVIAPNEHVPLTNVAIIAVTGGLSGRDTIERDTANARLIAAAPALLEAAKFGLSVAESWMRSELEGTDQFDAAMARLDPIRAAIAKATGDAS